MALDFSNRDPKDPNGIFALDTTGAQDAWISDDWSHVYYSQGEASRAGAKNKVRIARATTNDGHQFDVVVGGDGQPISQIGDSTGIDTKQHDAFQQTAPKPIPPSGAGTQVRKSPVDGADHIYGYNPTSGIFDQDQGPVTGPATTPHVEGTPTGQKDADGNPVFDNSKPIMVERDASGKQVGPAKPLTTEQRQQWEREKNGGRTDAENQTASAEEPVPNRPGWVQVTTKQGASSTVKFRGPDGKLVDALPPAPVTAKPEQDASGAWGYWDAQPGQQPAWKPISGGPAGKKYTEVKQDPVTGKWSGFTADGKWEAIEGGPGVKPDPGAFGVEPAGAPPIDTTYGAVTASTARYRDFLNEQVQLYHKSGGTQGIPEAQATSLMASRLAQAEAAVKESQGVIDTQRGIQQTAVQQRGNTLTDTAGRRTGAENTFNTVMNQFMPLLKYLPPGSGETFVKGMQEMLGLGQKNAENWGGMRESPEVPLGPAAAAANQAGPPHGNFLSPYQPPPNSAAVGPVGAGVTTTAAAAANPSGANINAANQATQAGFNAAAGPLLPPPPPVSPPNAIGLGTIGAVGMPPGQPGADPNAPVGMAPPGGTFLDAYGRPMPHPDSEVARMLNDPEMPNDVVAQAYREVYGTEMPYAA